MYAIVGAAGKVGYATSLALRRAGAPVRAILRDATKAAPLKDIGCDIALADLRDAAGLAKAIADADAVQIILPASPQATDTATEMRQIIESLTQALEQSRPACMLAISDYGAHVADDIGMPTMFRTFEERIGQLDGNKLFLRSAEHMQGWARVIPVAIASGILPSFHDPVDVAFPTISAPDLGLIAADLLSRSAIGRDLEIVHAEGPRRYSANDVAAVLSELLGRPIGAQALPRSQWKERLEHLMNASAADLLIKFNEACNKGGLVDIEPNAGEVRRGSTELIDALRLLHPSR